MFVSHITFVLSLMALVAGTFLYVWALRNGGAGKTLAAVVGFIVVVLSVISILCNGYYSYKFWNAVSSGQGQMMHPVMPVKNMQNVPAEKPAAHKHKRH